MARGARALVGPLLALFVCASPGFAQSLPATLDAAIATCTRLALGEAETPPADWQSRGSFPIPGSDRLGQLAEWDHPRLDMTLRLRAWGDGTRDCALGPSAPAFEPLSLDGRANVPVAEIRSAIARWATEASHAPTQAAGFIDGGGLDCTVPSGIRLGYTTSKRHLLRYQFWLVHQLVDDTTRAACGGR